MDSLFLALPDQTCAAEWQENGIPSSALAGACVTLVPVRQTWGRLLLLLGATLGLGSLLMEWASYVNVQGSGFPTFIASVSLSGFDYRQAPFVLVAAGGIAVCALLLAVTTSRLLALACTVAAVVLVGAGASLYLDPMEQAYERGFLVVANNVAVATDSDEIGVAEISIYEGSLLIDREEEMKRISLSPGLHAPFAAGIVSLVGVVVFSASRRRLPSSPSDPENVGVLAPVGAFLAGISCLMVWGHYQAAWPIESALILVDHPSFTGTDLWQWPFVVGIATLAAASLAVRSKASIGMGWVLRAAALGLIFLGVSIFVTAPSDSFDNELAPSLLANEPVSLSSLARIQGDIGGSKVFTEDRFRFDPGSVAPCLGGILLLLGTFRLHHRFGSETNPNAADGGTAA